MPVRPHEHEPAFVQRCDRRIGEIDQFQRDVSRVRCVDEGLGSWRHVAEPQVVDRGVPADLAHRGLGAVAARGVGRGEGGHRARTVALEEPRQTIMAGSRLVMDSTRLTQWGTWTGRIAAGGTELPIERMYGTKDRSWGVRPVGEPTPIEPTPQ